MNNVFGKIGRKLLIFLKSKMTVVKFICKRQSIQIGRAILSESAQELKPVLLPCNHFFVDFVFL